MATVRQIMEHAETSTTLNVIAIADHDQVRGSLEAVEWCAGRQSGRLQTLVATEISVAWGRHLLALFFDEPYPTRPFPRFRPLIETAAMVADKGGMVIVPHPLSSVVPSVGERTMDALMRQPQGRAAVQGLEVCSRVVGGVRSEQRIRRLNAERWHLAVVGSSDAHHLTQIGSAFTAFPGATKTDLRNAILDRATVAVWGELARISLRQHARQNVRSLILKPSRELRHAIRHWYRRYPSERGA